MSATILERAMLKTAVPARDMSVTTFLHEHQRDPPCHPWTAVWFGAHTALVWLHFWPGPTTPGGLAEAHESVVEQVQRGEIPAQAERREEAEEGAPYEQLAGTTE